MTLTIEKTLSVEPGYISILPIILFFYTVNIYFKIYLYITNYILGKVFNLCLQQKQELQWNILKITKHIKRNF